MNTLIRSVLCAVVLIGAVLPSRAQKDTVYTVAGDSYAVKVKDIKMDPVDRRYSVSLREDIPFQGRSLSSIPALYVSSIRFADGFELPVEGGLPDFAHIQQAPTRTVHFGKVHIEGVYPLSRDEVRQMLGDKYYYQAFVPVRNVQTLAYAQAACAAFYPLDMILKWSTTVENEVAIGSTGYYVSGELDVLGKTLSNFFLPTAMVGIGELLWSKGHLQRLVDDPGRYTITSESTLHALAWGGAACIVAGLGVTGAGVAQFGKHRHWKYEYAYDGTLHGRLIGQDDSKPGNIGWIVVLGSALTNLGLCQLTYALSGLEGSKALRDAGLSHLSVSLGPTPSGYGLAMRF